MRAPFAILGVALAHLFTLSQAAEPPRELLVYYPTQGAVLGETIAIKLRQLGVYDGLLRNSSISLYAPNTTRTAYGWESWQGDEEHACWRGGWADAKEALVDQVGTWTISWGVRYTISSDPSKANATYCGPGPFSSETWSFNATFEVREAGATPSQSASSGATITTRLPTQPTGSIPEVKIVDGRPSSASGVGVGRLIGVLVFASVITAIML